jgi:hypothetical protein
MAFRFLRCAARAVARHAGKLLFSLVPGVEAVYEIAADICHDYRQEQQQDELRADLQALARAPQDELNRQVREAVQAEAAHLPPEAQQRLAGYLSQVPTMIRRSLRRPQDPAGTTVPAALSLSHPEDLLPFLPPRPPRFQPGDRPLPGVDWVLEEPLGVGGFGEVWKARHAHLRSKAPVALKFCLNAEAAAVLRNEAGVLDRVMQHGRHPGIVPLLQTYLGADPPCLEYEYVEGQDLGGLIRELHQRGLMTATTASTLVLRLAQVVGSAHEAEPPIVHGDLKPANILVPATGEGFDPRVTDFGIGGLAAARERAEPTRSRQELLTAAVRGAYTPLYASPEQMARRRDEQADPRDDVHALGVIWYQCVTGDLGMLAMPPDWREQVAERGLGDDLVRLLASCIAPRADRRPASATDLAERLGAFLSPQSPGRPARERGPQGAGPPLRAAAADPPPLEEYATNVLECPTCGTLPRREDNYCKVCGSIHWEGLIPGLAIFLVVVAVGLIGLLWIEPLGWRIASAVVAVVGAILVAIILADALGAVALHRRWRRARRRRRDEAP